MPVARETTSAISSAPTSVRSSLNAGLPVARHFGLLQLRFQLRQLAVLDLGDLVELALALQFDHLAAQLVDFFLDVGAALHLGLLGFPDFFQVGVFAAEFVDLVFQQGQAFFRRLVGFPLHRLALDLQLDDAAVELVHHLGLGIDFHLDARGGLVDQVDGLVGQEAVGDVAMAQLGRGDDRRVGDVDAVVQFVALLQAAQDGDGRFDAGFVDQHLLEAAFQRGVLLDVLAVFVERGRADQMQFAARQRGLQHVAGVDRAFGLAGADQGVQFVEEDDVAAGVHRQFLQHRLQALLEFAAVFRAGQQGGEVEHQHLLALERLGHFVIDDPLRQPFDDGGLADAGLADQHRVVLGATLQDLDRTADFVVASDHRVELAVARARGEVERVFGERLALAFGFLRLHVLAAAHGLDGLFQRGLLGAVLLQQAAGFALVVQRRQQEQFGGDEGVVALHRLLVGQVQQIVELARDAHLAALAFDLGQPRQRLGQRRLQRRHLYAGTRQDRRRAGAFLVQQRQQQVLRLDVGMVAADGQALRVGKRLLELGGELVETHK